MNDFTKEELGHILWVFNESYDFNDRLMDDIRVKIRSMIKNYCDHSDQWGCATCRTFICEACDERVKK